MFIPENCKRCGICLSKCPVISMPVERSKEEIEKMINTRTSTVINSGCARCGYCNVICPTHSNPADLIDEMLYRKTVEKGAKCLSMMCGEVPLNLMTIAMDYETVEKEKRIAVYENPPESDTVFFLGCSVSCLHHDLAETRLIEGLPSVGGLKYCCGNYVHALFGDNESRIKGEKLLQELHRTGVKKIITFCPDCELMFRTVYPGLVQGFDIEVETISEYLLKKHCEGELDFPNTINKKIAFHDPCRWRGMDTGIYEAPRLLLESLGATVVEMKHNRRLSLCCGLPLISKNPQSAAQLAERRITEAIEAGAEALAVACIGCFELAAKAAEHNLDCYYITELVQIAIGEKPQHRLIKVREQLMMDVMQRISEEPDMMTGRYVIREGVVKKL